MTQHSPKRPPAHNAAPAPSRERKAVQERIMEAIESMAEGFMLCDEDDRVVLTNPRFHDFYPEIATFSRTGSRFHDIAEATARLGLVIGADTNPDAWIRQRKALRAGLSRHVQHLASGRTLMVSERRTVCGQTVTFFVDVTELKQREEELARHKEQAEGKARATGDFLASLSHELRTPLNAIIGLSDAILSNVFGTLEHSRYREYVHDIHRSGQHILSLINDVLDLSKIEAGHMSLELRPLELTAVIEQALSMTREAARASGLDLSVTLPEDGLPPIHGDERRLLQVMLNLLSNAVKFTPEGGRVSVDACRDGDALALRVADTGIGIADKDIPKAMEVFGQVGDTRLRRASGTGLGLPLARRLVELHGGTMSLHSEVDTGTTVTIRLPVHTDF